MKVIRVRCIEISASFGSDVYESVFFEGLRERAGGDAARDFQTVTITAGGSVSTMIASFGICFPSSTISSTTIFTAARIFSRASSWILPYVRAPLRDGQYA